MLAKFKLRSMSELLTLEKESESEVAQSCPIICDPMDCSLPGSSVHGIFQARVLEWGAILSISIPTNSVRELPFLHTLSSIYYL